MEAATATAPRAAAADAALFEVCIVERRQEAEGIVSLLLASPDGASLPPFEAGAHVDVQAAPGLLRPYSLCGDPRDRLHYRLGILREPQSRGGSAAMHAGFATGSKLRISRPRNNFRLVEPARHAILAGGGIGITPLLAMAWRLHAMDASFEVHYCTRSLDRTAFRELMKQAPFAERISLHLDDGNPEQRFAAAHVLAKPSQGTHLYACGPAGFMKHVTGEAARLGWRAEQVHVEHFSAEVDRSGGAFSIRTARSGRSLQVPADKTVAEVLLAAGIALPLSCEQGVCGTCIVGVLDGVPDHRDECLSDEERASNRLMTPCCSRARSAELLLDI